MAVFRLWLISVWLSATNHVTIFVIYLTPLKTQVVHFNVSIFLWMSVDMCICLCVTEHLDALMNALTYNV